MSRSYRAFISYSHADESAVKRLHRQLEAYRVPRSLVGQKTARGIVPRRLRPVFRDQDELATSTDLGVTIQRALADSAALIVGCSPRARASRWVGTEIEAFHETRPDAAIVPVIVAGDPGAPPGSDADPFPVALRKILPGGDAEPLGADIRPEQGDTRDARLRIIATLLGVGFDDLKRRDQARRNRRLAAIATTSLVIAGALIVLLIWALRAEDDARSEADRAAKAEIRERAERTRLQSTLSRIFHERAQVEDGIRAHLLSLRAGALDPVPTRVARIHRLQIEHTATRAELPQHAWSLGIATARMASLSHDRFLAVATAQPGMAIVDLDDPAAAPVHLPLASHNDANYARDVMVSRDGTRAVVYWEDAPHTRLHELNRSSPRFVEPAEKHDLGWAGLVGPGEQWTALTDEWQLLVFDDGGTARRMALGEPEPTAQLRDVAALGGAGRALVRYRHDGALRMNAADFTTGRWLGTVPLEDVDRQWRITRSPDGRHILCWGPRTEAVTFVDMSDPSSAVTYQTRTPPACVGFSPDGAYFGVLSGGGQLDIRKSIVPESEAVSRDCYDSEDSSLLALLEGGARLLKQSRDDDHLVLLQWDEKYERYREETRFHLGRRAQLGSIRSDPLRLVAVAAADPRGVVLSWDVPPARRPREARKPSGAVRTSVLRVGDQGPLRITGQPSRGGAPVQDGIAQHVSGSESVVSACSAGRDTGILVGTDRGHVVRLGADAPDDGAAGPTLPRRFLSTAYVPLLRRTAYIRARTSTPVRLCTSAVAMGPPAATAPVLDESGRLLGRLEHAPRTRLVGIATRPGGSGFVSVGADGSIWTWDVDPIRGTRKAALSSETLAQVVPSPNQERAVAISEDGTARIIDLLAGAWVGDAIPGTSRWASVTFDHDAKRAVVASRNDITVVSLEDGSVLIPRRRPGVIFSTNATAFDPRGRLWLGMSDGSVRRLDATLKEETEVVAGPPGGAGVTDIACSDDGRYVAVARGNDIRLLTQEEKPVAVRSHQTSFGDEGALVSFLDGGAILSCESRMYGGDSIHFDVSDGQVTWPRGAALDPIIELQPSPSGKRTLSVDEVGVVRVWDTRRQPTFLRTLPHGNRVQAMYLPNDDQALILESAGSAEATLRLIAIDSGEDFWTRALEDDTGKGYTLGSPTMLVLPRRGSVLVSTGHAVHVVAIADGTRRTATIAFPEQVDALVAAPDESRVAVLGHQGLLRIFDAATWQGEGTPVKGGTDRPEFTLWTRDGTRIVSLGDDFVVSDAHSGLPLLRRPGPSYGVLGMFESYDASGVHIVPREADLAVETQSISGSQRPIEALRLEAELRALERIDEGGAFVPLTGPEILNRMRLRSPQGR